MAIGKHNVRVAANADASRAVSAMRWRARHRLHARRQHRSAHRSHALSGTISIPDPVFRQDARICRAQPEQHGCPRHRVIGDSGPNQDGQNAVAAKLNAEWTGTARTPACTPSPAIIKRSGRRRGDHDQPRYQKSRSAITRPADTSQIMAVDPTWCAFQDRGMMERTASRGDPRGSTAEIGTRAHRRIWRAPSTSSAIHRRSWSKQMRCYGRKRKDQMPARRISFRGDHRSPAMGAETAPAIPDFFGPWRGVGMDPELPRPALAAGEFAAPEWMTHTSTAVAIRFRWSAITPIPFSSRLAAQA